VPINSVPGLSLARYLPLSSLSFIIFFAQIKEYGGGVQSTEEKYTKFCSDTGRCLANLVFVPTSDVTDRCFF
jgi:hypothetical protein